MMRAVRSPLLSRTRHGSGVAFAGTLVVHATLGAAVLIGPLKDDPPQPVVYQVNLVAAPAPRPEERRAPDAVQRPSERPVAVSPREPRRTSVAPETPPRPAPDTEAPVRTVSPEPPIGAPSTGEDPGTIETSGVEFPFPGYIRNIVAQVYRRWRAPEGNVALRAEILFFIRRDGSVTNLQFASRSGNFVFDLEAQGAIEAAANAGAFGPLPDLFQGDILPVNFFFDPESLR